MNKKIKLVKRMLLIFSFLMLAAFIFTFISSFIYVKSLIDLGNLSLTSDLSNIINYMIANTLSYLFYALALFGIASVLNVVAVSKEDPNETSSSDEIEDQSNEMTSQDDVEEEPSEVTSQDDVED